MKSFNPTFVIPKKNKFRQEMKNILYRLIKNDAENVNLQMVDADKRKTWKNIKKQMAAFKTDGFTEKYLTLLYDCLLLSNQLVCKQDAAVVVP